MILHILNALYFTHNGRHLFNMNIFSFFAMRSIHNSTDANQFSSIQLHATKFEIIPSHFIFSKTRPIVLTRGIWCDFITIRFGLKTGDRINYVIKITKKIQCEREFILWTSKLTYKIVARCARIFSNFVLFIIFTNGQTPCPKCNQKDY